MKVYLATISLPVKGNTAQEAAQEFISQIKGSGISGYQVKVVTENEYPSLVIVVNNDWMDKHD